MRARRILIGGIGNIFLGDDAFGVATVHHLMNRDLPANVTVVDFGTRSYDLLYAVTGGFDAVILLDTVRHGQPPGTLFLIAPDQSGQLFAGTQMINAHAMTPAVVFEMIRSFGKPVENLYLIGCEPATLESEDGGVLVLSENVRAAIPAAIDMTLNLVQQLLRMFEAETILQRI